MRRIGFPALIVVAALLMTAYVAFRGSRPVIEDSNSAGSLAFDDTDALAARINSVLPTAEEETWLQVTWRLDLDQARAEAQRIGKPLFLWINEGHPLGCV